MKVDFIVEVCVTVGAEVQVDVEGFVAVWADGVVVVDGKVNLFVVFELVVDGHDLAVVEVFSLKVVEGVCWWCGQVYVVGWCPGECVVEDIVMELFGFVV